MSPYVAKKTAVKNRTTSLFLALITLTSGLLAALPASVSAVSVDDISPPSGTASNSLSYLPVRANVTLPDPVSVGISSAIEWGRGDFGEYTQLGAGPALQLRTINSEDWSSGQIDPFVWETAELVVIQNGVLNMTGDETNGFVNPVVRSNYRFSLQDEPSINLTATGSLTAGEGAYMMPGGWVDAAAGTFVGFFFSAYGEDTYSIYFDGYDAGNYESYDAGVSIPLGQPTSIRIRFTSTVIVPDNFIQGDFVGEYLDINSGTWVEVATISQNVIYKANYQMSMGTDIFGYCCYGQVNHLEVSSIAVDKVIEAASGTYTSAPLMLPAMKGAYLQSINVTTSDGQMNGIAAITLYSSMNDTGPWSAPFDATAAVNIALDMAIDGPWVQFVVDLEQNDDPSWISAVSFSVNYHTDVGLYWYNDLSGPVNTALWNYSGGATTSQGLVLDSLSTETSVGITYPNASWDLGGPHSVETLSIVRVELGSSVPMPGNQADNMLLSGFNRVSPSGVGSGYIGVVRHDSGSSAYWALSYILSFHIEQTFLPGNEIMTSGPAVIRTSLVNGVFQAWVLELDNAWRGWLDLGSVSLSANGVSDGTVWWRQGDVGTHYQANARAIVDWSALLLKDMTPPVFGSSWDAGNTNLNEDENDRAVIAISGPTWSMQLATYILDTTAPTGSFTVNAGGGFTTQLAVTLHLTASDRYGVTEYAASESLSFPEGFRAFTSDPTFLLSPGDARKVIWVVYKDSNGVLSTPVNQSIQLDTVDPEGTLYINDRAASTTVTNVTLLLLANDLGGVEFARISNDPLLPVNQWTTIDLKDYTIPSLPAVNQTITQNVDWTLSAGDGVKYVYVQYVDVHGRTSRMLNSTILLDSTAPQVTASLLGTIQRGGTTYLNTTRAVVRVAASDASGVKEIEISETNGFTNPARYTSPGDLVYEFTGSSGNRTLFVRATDIFDLTSTVITMSFFVDVSAPTGTISINGGTDTTTSRTVTLNLTATDNIGVESMQLSTSLYFPGAVWEPFAPQVSKELSPGDGPAKTVYVRFRDVNGRESQAFFDTIALDTTPPTGFIIVNNGDLSTIDRNLNLQLEAFDNFPGQLEIRYSLNASFGTSPWLPFGDTIRFDGGTDEGNVVVYYQIRDVNGLMSEVYSDGIRIRKATCEDTNSCVGPGAPGFEGPLGIAALAMVAVVAAALRRKR